MNTIAQNESSNALPLHTEETGDASARPKKRRVTKLRTVGTFLRRGACSDTLMTVLDRADGHPMTLEERASDPLAGGMMMGYQCGMLWGSALAAGAQAHRLHGPGPEAETRALHTATKVVDAFRDCHGSTDCLDITEADPQSGWQTFKYFLLKGGVATCGRRMARFAPVAQREIQGALAEELPAPSCAPGNCAARMARMLGAPSEHATMAAGLAGGIGLSGGGCGALGTAIWLLGVEGRRAGLAQKTVNARIETLKERFGQATEFELECAAIVGRRFASLDDHAAHVNGGGCAALLQTLAETVQSLTAADAATAGDEDAQNHEAAA